MTDKTLEEIKEETVLECVEDFRDDAKPQEIARKAFNAGVEAEKERVMRNLTKTLKF